MDRIENLSATKTKIHIPCPTRSFRLGLIDVVQRLHKLRTYLLTETALPRIFNSICFIRYSRPRKSALHKLCTNIDQPYLIWAAVLCDVSILHQKTNDTGTKNPKEKKAWLHFHHDFCRLGVAPKMKSGRPIIYFLNKLLQQLSQLKLNKVTSTIAEKGIRGKIKIKLCAEFVKFVPTWNEGGQQTKSWISMLVKTALKLSLYAVCSDLNLLP